MVDALLVCVCVDIARRHDDPGFGGTGPCRLWRHGRVVSRVTRKGMCVWILPGGMVTQGLVAQGHGRVVSRVTRKGSFWESLLSYK